MNRPRTYQEWLRRRQPPPQKPKPKTLKDRLWECWSGFLICVCYAIILSPFMAIGGLIGHIWKHSFIGAIIGLVIGLVGFFIATWIMLMRLLWNGL